MFDENQIVKTKWTAHNKDWLTEHGYKFTKYNNYLEVKAKDLPIGSSTKIKVICDECGKEFYVNYSCYLKAAYKGLCRQCALRKAAKQRQNEHAQIAIKQANDMCDNLGYILVTTENDYSGTNGDIKYICKKHGAHTAKLANFLRGHGCPECARELTGERTKLTVEEVIRRIESVNGNQLLNPEDYVDVFTNNLIIKCSCGNTFKTDLHNYRHSYRCKQCSDKESYNERKIREYLEELEIEYIQEKRFVDCRDKIPLPFYFYLPQYNLCIEYDGEQHYWNVFSESSTNLTQKHDKIKTEYCQRNNINLLRIPYYENKNIKEILKNYLQV